MYISQLKSHGQLGHLATLVSNFTDRHQAGLFKTLESVSCQDFNSMIQEDAFFSVPTTEVAMVQLPLSCKKWCSDSTFAAKLFSLLLGRPNCVHRRDLCKWRKASHCVPVWKWRLLQVIIPRSGFKHQICVPSPWGRNKRLVDRIGFGTRLMG